MNGGLNTIFLTNKNVFGLEGEATCQFLLFFFCIASRQAELALSLTKIWFSLWNPAVVYSIFACISSFAIASAHIIISQGGFLQAPIWSFSFFVGSFSCV